MDSTTANSPIDGLGPIARTDDSGLADKDVQLAIRIAAKGVPVLEPVHR